MDNHICPSNAMIPVGPLSHDGKYAPRVAPVRRLVQSARQYVQSLLFSSCTLLMIGLGPNAAADPLGGVVTSGSATIGGTTGHLQIDQSSANAIINWQSFSIGKTESVTFVQPSSKSVILNRVVGGDPSTILGRLAANGNVFLVNPNGILFGKGAQVNAGGIVASTLGISDADFNAGNYRLIGAGNGGVINRGTISASGGYIALLGAKVDNEGVITAQLGSVVLASGTAMTLDVAGNGLLNVAVSSGAVNALVKNGGMIKADGGQVILTAQAAGQLLKSVVNNTGIIEAETVNAHNGTIKLLGDMQTGTVNVSGSLDASAPNGGDGGAIETSAATVNVAPAAKITTAAPKGVTGKWTIDPVDFTVGASGNISGSTLSALLVTNSVDISTLPGAASGTAGGTPPSTIFASNVVGNGDININQAVSWTAAPSTTTLTLNAARDINVNAPISATNGNVVACCGRDVNVNAAITTVNGSVLLSAGNNINLNAVSALTTTDGNITLCAGLDINVDAAITLTRGSAIPAQSLGLTQGLVFIAGNGGTGPGVAGGTVTFGAAAPPVTVTGPDAPALIEYNPTSYATPTNYSGNFTLTNGASLTEKMLVFPQASKIYDGTDTATLSGFNTNGASGVPAGLTLVAGPTATATYATSAVGQAIPVNFSGYSLAGANAGLYALANNCCTPGAETRGTITALASPTPTPTPPTTPPTSGSTSTPSSATTPTTTSTPASAPGSSTGTTSTPSSLPSSSDQSASLPSPAATPSHSSSSLFSPTATPGSSSPSTVANGQNGLLSPEMFQNSENDSMPVILVPTIPVTAIDTSSSPLTLRGGGVKTFTPAPVSPMPTPVALPTAYPPKQDRF